MFIYSYYSFSTISTIYMFMQMVQSIKPANNHLLSTWRIECELDVIIDPECPIDGGWSHWAPWSSCVGACDSVGHQIRKRVCNNPPPSKDGIPCHGIDEQIQSCYKKNCSVEDYRIIVNGDLSRMEALRQLESVPLIMERCLQIECPYEAIEVALTRENTWQINSELLWNALQCVKHDLGCSLNGEWGAWGPWSTCGARCGKGLTWRFRKCNSPPPSMFNLVCLGLPLQSNKCEGDQCAIDGQYTEIGVSGTWAEWEPWTPCSERCGTGVRRRKRRCLEKHIYFPVIFWRTHCRGQYNEFEICRNKKCVLDGGWSGWGPWGQCSQTCGAGKRSRARSCTRPIPAGGGANCIGNRIEVNSCYLTPCEVYSHTVAIFNGDSHLLFNLSQRRSKFFHVYIRFLALSPHGTLLRRGEFTNPSLRISLHKWYICFEAKGSSKTCSVSRICSATPLKTSFWHSVMVTVTNEAVKARINNEPISLYNPFPCDPELINNDFDIVIGEKLHGEIQELVFNFMPISIFVNSAHSADVTNETDLTPNSFSNIVYEKATIEEAFLKLENENYLVLSCFEVQHEWHFEITIKSNKERGTIFFFTNYNTNDCFYMILDNMRIKLKYMSNRLKSEAISSTECVPNQWLDIKLDKIIGTNIIEVSINNAERLHIILSENSFKKRSRSNNKDIFIKNNSLKTNVEDFTHYNQQNSICTDAYFIGGIPIRLKNNISEDLPPFVGVIAALKVNNDLLDLHKIDMERYKDRTIQLSSRTASISGSYREVTWLEDNKLILTCVYARVKKLDIENSAFWLALDTEIQNSKAHINTGRVSRLTLSHNNDQPGFYTCRAGVNDRSRNFITYALLGKYHNKHSNLDMTTISTIFTTISLVIFTLGWLIIEGYNDVCDGYGFFRDHQPDNRESDDIRKISESFDGLGNSATICDKGRCTKQLSQFKINTISTRTFLQQEENQTSNDDIYEPNELPALPQFKSSISKSNIIHKVYRCEPSFNTSHNHDSEISSVKSRFPSSYIDNSPRYLYSQLFLEKKKTTPNENLKTKVYITKIRNDKLLSIKKVLQKFYDLKSES